MATTRRRFLMVYDFDHTIMDDNTDTFVHSGIGAAGRHFAGPLPDSIRKSDLPWTDLMQSVFVHHHGLGINRQDYENKLNDIPFTKGMQEALKALHGEEDGCLGGEAVIISDSNEFFIDHILTHNGLKSLFRKVFTNPAEFDSDGLLKIKYFHLNEDCKLSGKNLCKGKVLQDYLKERKDEGVEYDFVGYVGDGTNDFCPMLRLREQDLAFTRIGERYRISREIQKRSSEGLDLKAKRMDWTDDAGAILTGVKEKLES